MKRILLLAFLFCTFSAFADTLTTSYSVSLRGKVMGTYSKGQTIRVVMKADSIATFDTLKVNVSNEAPCANCSYTLLVFGSKGPMLVDTLQRTEDFYIPLAPLVAEYRKSGTYIFNGYYTQYFADPSKSKVISFEIRLR